jgi:hypothetical protein
MGAFSDIFIGGSPVENSFESLEWRRFVSQENQTFSFVSVVIFVATPGGNETSGATK